MRSLEFASCYVYAPCGACEVSARSRSLRAMIKAAEPALVPLYARCVMRQAHLMPSLAEFFRAIDVLIPIPASAPSRGNRDYLPDRLADAFVAEGPAQSACCGQVGDRSARTAADGAGPLRLLERRARLRSAG